MHGILLFLLTSSTVLLYTRDMYIICFKHVGALDVRVIFLIRPAASDELVRWVVRVLIVMVNPKILHHAGPSEGGADIRQQLTRIEAASLNTFHHMFAPSISDLTQRSKLVKKLCTETYNAYDRPNGQLWCMVLGRYLQDDMIKACHIYKRSWPAQTAVS